MAEGQDSSVHHFRMELPGIARYVRAARRFVLSVCRLAGVDEDARDSIGLALTEILNNSIDHGESSATPIEVEIEVGDKSIRMVVTETSSSGWQGPDMQRIHDDVLQPTPDDTQFRGRGLLLVCSLMDDMQVRAADHGGTVVEVVKLR